MFNLVIFAAGFYLGYRFGGGHDLDEGPRPV